MGDDGYPARALRVMNLAIGWEARAARRQSWVVQVAALLGQANGVLAGQGGDVRVLRQSIVRAIAMAAALEQSLARRRTHLKRRIDGLALALGEFSVRSDLDQKSATVPSPGTGDGAAARKSSNSDEPGADLTPK